MAEDLTCKEVIPLSMDEEFEKAKMPDRRPTAPPVRSINYPHSSHLLNSGGYMSTPRAGGNSSLLSNEALLGRAPKPMSRDAPVTTFPAKVVIAKPTGKINNLNNSNNDSGFVLRPSGNNFSLSTSQYSNSGNNTSYSRREYEPRPITGGSRLLSGNMILENPSSGPGAFVTPALIPPPVNSILSSGPISNCVQRMHINSGSHDIAPNYISNLRLHNTSTHRILPPNQNSGGRGGAPGKLVPVMSPTPSRPTILRGPKTGLTKPKFLPPSIGNNRLDVEPNSLKPNDKLMTKEQQLDVMMGKTPTSGNVSTASSGTPNSLNSTSISSISQTIDAVIGEDSVKKESNDSQESTISTTINEVITPPKKRNRKQQLSKPGSPMKSSIQTIVEAMAEVPRPPPVQVTPLVFAKRGRGGGRKKKIEVESEDQPVPVKKRKGRPIGSTNAALASAAANQEILNSAPSSSKMPPPPKHVPALVPKREAFPQPESQPGSSKLPPPEPDYPTILSQFCKMEVDIIRFLVGWHDFPVEYLPETYASEESRVPNFDINFNSPTHASVIKSLSKKGKAGRPPTNSSVARQKSPLATTVFPKNSKCSKKGIVLSKLSKGARKQMPNAEPSAPESSDVSTFDEPTSAFNKNRSGQALNNWSTMAKGEKDYLGSINNVAVGKLEPTVEMQKARNHMTEYVQSMISRVKIDLKADKERRGEKGIEMNRKQLFAKMQQDITCVQPFTILNSISDINGLLAEDTADKLSTTIPHGILKKMDFGCGVKDFHTLGWAHMTLHNPDAPAQLEQDLRRMKTYLKVDEDAALNYKASALVLPPVYDYKSNPFNDMQSPATDPVVSKSIAGTTSDVSSHRTRVDLGMTTKYLPEPDYNFPHGSLKPRKRTVLPKFADQTKNLLTFDVFQPKAVVDAWVDCLCMDRDEEAGSESAVPDKSEFIPGTEDVRTSWGNMISSLEQVNETRRQTQVSFLDIISKHLASLQQPKLDPTTETIKK
uniref:PHD-type domain-containing protein n=1 Tax=Rhabditophanes sp. KR3021 TaxID=114890 RepID=A0AC35TYR4_9BILA